MFEPVLTGRILNGHYHDGLALLSFGIALLASYTALETGRRISQSSGKIQKIWANICAFVMGGGIWSMHFTAMMAFQLPIPVTYDMQITLASLAIAVAASGIAFFIAGFKSPSIYNIAFGGFVLGLGVAAMHYSGMAAMEISGEIYYRPGLFALSIIIAIVAATTALWLIFIKSAKELTISFPLKISASFVMAFAIAGMHYCGMAGTVFVAVEQAYFSPQAFANAAFLGKSVSASTLFILGMTILALMTEKKFHKIIKDKKKLERQIQSFAEIPRENPLPVIRINRDSKIAYANPAALSLLGHWNAGINNAAPGVFHESVLKAFSTRENNSLNIDAGYRKYRLDAVFNEDLDAVHLYGTDITEIETLRDALTTERQKLYGLLDNLPISFHLQAPDYSIPYSNKIFRQRFGNPENKKCHEVIYQRERPCEECFPFRVFETRSNESSVWTAPDGKTYLTVCTPFKDIDGIDMVMEMAMDISEQEAAKREAIDAKEEAERANHAKSEFLSRMSHELRTPLNAILGFSQLMEMNATVESDRTLARNVRLIHNAGNHLLEMVNEVLDLARIESGNMDLISEEIDIAQLKEEVLSLTAPLANEKGIEITAVSKIPGPVIVKGDQTRLRQVLLNLISNGIKYNSPKGKICVTLEKNIEGWLRIGVRDTGPGVMADQLERLFEPFDRLNADERGVEGAGIGLAISKRLVELMGGKIAVESEPGKGSYFIVEMPPGEASIKGRTPLDKPADAGPDDETRQSIILYIEDNPDNIELIRQVLGERKHIELLSAPEAEMGISLAKAHRPDLILMDINLSGMSGLEALKNLRQAEETMSIPVVALSADAMERQIRNGLELGFNSYLTKPVDVKLLLREVDRLLK